MDEAEENVVQRQIQWIEVDAFHRDRPGQNVIHVVERLTAMVSGSLLIPTFQSYLRIARAALSTTSLGIA